MDPLISAGFQQIGSTALNAISGAINYSRDKKMMDYKYEKDLELWNAQNAYNDPSAQMQRLAKAGLSPYLVYGSGGVSGNTTSNAPQMAQIQSKTDLGQVNMLNSYIDIKNGLQQNANMVAQGDLIKEQEANVAAKTIEIMDRVNNSNPVLRNLWNSNTDKNRSGIKLQDSQTENNKWNLQFNKDMWKYNMDAASLKNDVLRVQLKNYFSDLVTKGNQQAIQRVTYANETQDNKIKQQVRQRNYYDNKYKKYGLEGGIMGSGISAKTLYSIPSNIMDIFSGRGGLTNSKLKW